MRYIIIISGLLAQQVSQAFQICDKEIKGTVLSLDTKDPLPYAIIQIEGTHLGAVADSLGRFQIGNVCEGEIHLSVSFVGHKTVTHHHDFYHPDPVIYLASDEIELESIVIEETRSDNLIKSLAVSTKEIETLEALGSSAGDLVLSLTGVHTLKTGQNVAKPIVHGLHSNRVLIVNNGVRHAYQAWGTENAPEIDPSQIDRITLIKGAATVQHGPEALGGVILFNSTSPKYDQPLNGEVSTRFESNGRAISGQLALNQGFHRFAWNGSVYGTRQGDLKAPGYQLTNTGKSELGFQFGAKLHRPVFDLNFYASHFEQNLGILRGSVVGNLEDLANAIDREPPANTQAFSYNINNPKQETSHDLFKAKSSIYLRSNIINVQYAFQRNLRKEFDIRRGSNNDRPAIDLALVTHSVDADWNLPWGLPLESLLGLQFFYQDNDNQPGTHTIPFIPNYNIVNIGLFSVHKIFSGGSTYEIGARYDYQNIDARGRDSNNDVFRNDLTYNNVTFNMGYERRLSKELKLRANLSSAWRPPKVGELYSFGKHHFTIEYGLWRYELFPENDSISTLSVLNNDINEVKSEQGLKWIGELSLNKTSWGFEMVPYLHFIRNYFYTRPYGITHTVRGSFPYFIHDQAHALFQGIDADLSIQHHSTMESEVKFAYVHAKDIQNNQFFLEIPPLNISYTFRKSFNAIAFSVSGSWTATQWNAPEIILPGLFVDETAVIDRNGTFDFMDAPDGYFLLNTSIDFKKDFFSSSLSINNVLNQSYRAYTDRLRYFSDDVGTNVALALSYRLSK